MSVEQERAPSAGVVRPRSGRRLGDLHRRLRPITPAQAAVYDVEPRGAILVRERRTRRMLAAGDLLAVVLAVTLTFAWAAGQLPGPAILLFAPLVVGIHKVAGLYDRDDLVLNRSTLDEIPLLLQVGSVLTLLISAIGVGLTDTRLAPEEMVVLWLVATALVTAGRVVARAGARAFSPSERCLVVADAAQLEHVCRKLDGVQRAEVVAGVGLQTGQGRAITDVEEMREVIARHDVHRVVVAPMSHDGGDTVTLVRCAKAAGVRVSILPRVLEAVGSSVEFEQLDGITMLGVRPLGLSRSSVAVKRAFDLLFGLLALVAVSPVFLALALAVRIDTPGPVFFRQVRIGRDGKPFRIWKFRSMVLDAEERKEDLLDLNEVDGGMFKIAEDPRVTRVGRFLRRTSLDELPQILNVLTGEMSLVGPRPLVVDEDALVEGIYRARLHLTPGMTGPWQILGATRVPMEEMVVMDYLYVANWSLWADVKLLLRTVPHVLARRGL